MKAKSTGGLEYGTKKNCSCTRGNAIQSGEATASAARSVGKTAEQLVKIMENDVDIVIAHGNGPQVGNILLQQKAAETEKTPAMPLDTCGAMSQGMIGYWMENAIEKALKNGI